MEISVPAGIGASDVQQAVRSEVVRIAELTKGDVNAQVELLYERLRALGLLTDDEVGTLSKLAHRGDTSGVDQPVAPGDYFRARDLLTGLLAGGNATPVAMTLAASAVGSYSISENPDGSGTVVVYAKNNGEWEKRAAAIGALLGAEWGPGGAALGGLIGGAVGSAVDHCLK